MIVEIADIPFEIVFRHPENEAFFQDYRSDRHPDFVIQASDEDLVQMQEGFNRTALAEGTPLHQYADSFLENNAIHGLLAQHMIDHDVLLIHGSALCMDGMGYIFTASSGTGKSTHARLWRKVFGSRVWMVNDDKPMLKVSDDGVTVYGTPWNGKHHLGCNAGAPLKAIIKLSRAPENHIRPLDKTDAFRVVLEHAYGSRDTRSMLKIMELEKRIIDVVDFYHLSCNMEPEAAIVAWEGMNPGAERSSYEDASDE